MKEPVQLPEVGGPTVLPGYQRKPYRIGKFGGAYYWQRPGMASRWFGGFTTQAKAEADAEQETNS